MIESKNLSYFISDVHLSDARPEITARFTAFFDMLFLAPAQPRNVFILGDLFDMWLGDDIQTPLVEHVTRLFQRCAAENITLYFMAGNRDYLLGKQFSEKAQVKLVADPTIAHLCGQTILLTHGDQFMTLDKKYIKYRSIAQHPLIIKYFPKLPFWFRNSFARFLRNGSQKQNKTKARYVMDVDPITVEQWFKSHRVDNMIHGHVHQMGVYQHLNATRHVLGDWYTQGNYIKVDEQSISLNTLPEA